MASLQHVYRRGHIFWWRRIHRFSNGMILDVRLSLKTVDRLDARNRGAALTAASGGVLEMLDHKAKANDARPTEDELQAIAKIAYDELLTEICTDQRSTPHLRDAQGASNLAFADYYQRLTNNGGHASLLPAEERELAETWEWDRQRIDDLRHIVQLREEKGHTRIRPDAVDRWLPQAGIERSGQIRRDTPPSLIARKPGGRWCSRVDRVRPTAAVAVAAAQSGQSAAGQVRPTLSTTALRPALVVQSCDDLPHKQTLRHRRLHAMTRKRTGSR
jgi:hypothetical protein